MNIHRNIVNFIGDIVMFLIGQNAVAEPILVLCVKNVKYRWNTVLAGHNERVIVNTKTPSSYS